MNIHRAFSKAAATYDAHAHVQQEAGAHLLKNLSPFSPGSILDFGCGTGHFTLRLAQTFPTAKITAIDTAAHMIRYAQNTHSHPNITYHTTHPSSQRYDCIVSNSCLHWLPDLSETLRQFSGQLFPSGIFAASIFGPETFQELNAILSEEFPSLPATAASHFRKAPKLCQEIQRYFNSRQIRHYKEIRIFNSLMDLLRHIHYTGVQGISPPHIWSPALIRRLEPRYRRKFGQIVATFQFITVSGVRL